jgi:hypothetical protein
MKEVFVQIRDELAHWADCFFGVAAEARVRGKNPAVFEEMATDIKIDCDLFNEKLVEWPDPQAMEILFDYADSLVTISREYDTDWSWSSYAKDIRSTMDRIVGLVLQAEKIHERIRRAKKNSQRLKKKS